ncbi:MAG: hypothetical protein IJ427_03395 [Lachnospiraceae bacterium]|nr:hypothetical protein [Lachnospiraceae bacterium]
MKFTWEDYSVTYKDVVETWLDEEAKQFTGCDDGFEEFYNYWANEADTRVGESIRTEMHGIISIISSKRE